MWRTFPTIVSGALLLPPQVQSQRCPGMAPLHCRWLVGADEHAATWFKPCEAAREGSVFSVFSLLSWLQRGLCAISSTVQTVTLHGPVPHVIHFHYQTPTVIKMHRMVEPRNVVWRSWESSKVMWLRVSDLTAMIDADGNSSLRSFCSQHTGIGVTHHHMLRNQGERKVQRGAAAAHEAKQWSRRWAVTDKCLSETTRSILLLTFLQKSNSVVKRQENRPARPVSGPSAASAGGGAVRWLSACGLLSPRARFLTPLTPGVDQTPAPSVINHSCLAQIYSCERRTEEKTSGRYRSVQLNIK